MSRFKIIVLCIVVGVCGFGCGTDYKDISDPNGRQAIVDQANNYLTSGMCEEAMNVLRPLWISQWKTDKITMLYASAYACKAGFSFPALLYGLISSTNGIWSAIVKANYSASSTDGHVANLRSAADTLRYTSSGGITNFSAATRPTEANVYMLFIQTAILGAVMSELGSADPATGNPVPKPAVLKAPRTDDDKCDVAVAFATINDCISYAPSGSAINNLSAPIKTVCADANVMLAGGCPTTLDRTVCTGAGGAADRAKGEELIKAIALVW